MTAIPLVVVGGYLGAGKTTLLNHVLTHAGQRRIAVLVNDFGSINIDASLIRERTNDVISLENGCICCSIGGRLVEALVAVSARPEPPELLIIEASGVSDPVRIAQIGLLDRAFRLDAILVVVDAEHIGETLNDPYVGDIARCQIRGASALVLNKMDLLDERTKDAVAARIGELAGSRVMLRATHGAVPLGFVFDTHVPPARHDKAAPLTGSPVAPDLCSFSLTISGRLDREKLKAALRNLPGHLLRAKGLVWLDHDAMPYELHVVGQRILMTPFTGHVPDESSIVLIGMFSHEDESQAGDALSASRVACA